MAKTEDDIVQWFKDRRAALQRRMDKTGLQFYSARFKGGRTYWYVFDGGSEPIAFCFAVGEFCDGYAAAKEKFSC